MRLINLSGVHDVAVPGASSIRGAGQRFAAVGRVAIRVHLSAKVAPWATDLVALHSDFDRLGPAVRLAPAGVLDQ